VHCYAAAAANVELLEDTYPPTHCPIATMVTTVIVPIHCTKAADCAALQSQNKMT
jgi:hypothetical protein